MAEHAIVVGAGIVGLNCAYALRREGFDVTLLDPDDPGTGASFGNAGLLGTGGVVPVPTPGVLARLPRMLLAPDAPVSIRWRHLPSLTPWLLRFLANCRPERVEHNSRALAALLAPTHELYGPIFEDVNAAHLIRRTGAIYAYASEASFRSGEFERNLRRTRGVEVVELGEDEMRQMVPALARDVVRGIHLPDAAFVASPIALSQAIARRLADLGVMIAAERVTGLLLEGGRVVGVKSAEREHRGALVVIAAGAYSKPLSAQLGCRLPLDTERGYHVMIKDPGIDIRLPVTSIDGAFAATPMQTGLRIAGKDELANLEAPPNYGRADALLRRAKRLFPGLNPEAETRWMGRRPSMPDSLPVIGRAPGHDNAYLAFGHGHLGLTMGAVTGRIVADLAVGRAPPVDLTPYRPERF